ncbi:hypothetical protein AAFF_G00237160 [Aldrovandia affinis]|uniref:Uncharacterized protein n=1 Tax=Aldrovandia affinis TaxID=143900 RepID=A0AAD7W4K4_9TELE|nr:hypothetical protein AAFF_G00237160 [Aldrovandia affinis]
MSAKLQPEPEQDGIKPVSATSTRRGLQRYRPPLDRGRRPKLVCAARDRQGRRPFACADNCAGPRDRARVTRVFDVLRRFGVASAGAEAYHQRCLRKIFKITWEDRRTNTSVLEEANIPAITATIAQHQLRWTGHVIRMPDSRLPKQ